MPRQGPRFLPAREKFTPPTGAQVAKQVQQVFRTMVIFHRKLRELGITVEPGGDEAQVPEERHAEVNQAWREAIEEAKR